jgi:outer membrane beta-barrel protein
MWIGQPSETYAAPLTEDRVDVFQLKPITKKRRHEFVGLFTASVNDGFLQTLMGGGSYTFHISEGIGIEASGLFGTGLNTTIVDRLRSGEGTTTRADGSEIKINPDFARPQIFAFGNLVWSPFPGKFTSGNLIFDVDIYFVAGAGYVRTNRDNLFGMSFGMGLRVMMLSWLVMRLDVRDYIYSQRLLGGTVSVLNHNIFVTLGLGFVFPVNPLYTS